MPHSASTELKRLAQFVAGVEEAGHEVTYCEVIGEADTSSTVRVRIPLVDDVAGDADVWLEDATLADGELQLTAAVSSTDETGGATGNTTPTTTASSPNDTPPGPTTDTAGEPSDGTAGAETTARNTEREASSDREGDDDCESRDQSTPTASSTTPADETSTTDPELESEKEPDETSTGQQEQTHDAAVTTADPKRPAASPADGDNEHETDADAGVGDSADDDETPNPDDTENGLPVHRDPDQLAVVYDSERTFAEMTEELGADVTPQTVRKYMVKYGIHTPSSRGTSDNAAQNGEGSSVEAATAADESGEPEQTNESETDDGSVASDSADGDAETVDELAEANADVGENSPPDPPEMTDASDIDVESDGELDVDKLRERIGPTNLPDGVTVEDLVAAVSQSRTVYEVRSRLNLENGEARQLLKRCELVDLVTGRITQGNTTPSEEEVIRRLLAAFATDEAGDGDQVQSAS